MYFRIGGLSSAKLCTQRRHNLITKAPTLAETISAFHDLNMDASPGHMKITVAELAATLDMSLEHHNMMHRLMWTHSVTPGQLGEVCITPVLKPGKDNSKPASFRPISVTPPLTKWFEKIIHARMLELLKDIPELFRRQSGWQKKRGAHEALFDAMHHIRTAQSRNRCGGLIKMDIRKFFDTIDRRKLWIKLEELGIRGKLLSWIRQHMDGVCYLVKANGSMSCATEHQLGLPQGSILSPILSAIFTEDAPDFIMDKAEDAEDEESSERMCK